MWCFRFLLLLIPTILIPSMLFAGLDQMSPEGWLWYKDPSPELLKKQSERSLKAHPIKRSKGLRPKTLRAPIKKGSQRFERTLKNPWQSPSCIQPFKM